MPKLSVLPVPWVPLPLYLCQSWPQLPFRTNKNGKCSKQTLKQLTHIVTLCQINVKFLSNVLSNVGICLHKVCRMRIAWPAIPSRRRLSCCAAFTCCGFGQNILLLWFCYGSLTVLLRFLPVGLWFWSTHIQHTFASPWCTWSVPPFLFWFQSRAKAKPGASPQLEHAQPSKSMYVESQHMQQSKALNKLMLKTGQKLAL